MSQKEPISIVWKTYTPCFGSIEEVNYYDLMNIPNDAISAPNQDTVIPHSTGGV